ncbi:MAG: patatin-like phospholipase family protein [Oscillospiraceae bacterium]|nr:patatin-like phospholipase family protein [Oscillospiraceae bacterium]
MDLKLDTSTPYAIALEGGGAKGAYEIGVWRALQEAGIQYCAVSGTSVGALNGALMVMGDLERATEIWKELSISKVINLEGIREEDFSRVVGGEIEFSDLSELLPKFLEIIRSGGLDVAPLRDWVREVIDPEKVKQSQIPLFVNTVSISDMKDLEIRVNDLSQDEIIDMLLASAYHPTFRQSRLGGKFYTDGGFADSLPLHVLVENGYKQIIAVRIPGHGVERRFKLPDDVSVTYITTHSDLGSSLNFTQEQSLRDLEIGYYDAKRVLYGLSGIHYYIERSLTDLQALELLYEYAPDGTSLRNYCEKILPAMATRLDVPDGAYYDILIALREQTAESRNLPNMQIYPDQEFLRLTQQ